MTFNHLAGASSLRPCRCECGCVTRARCYPSDLTDEQWEQLEPLLPVMLCLTVLGGRPEKHARRTMVNALFYVLDSGCKWRSLPADFPPWQTVYSLFARWTADGAWPVLCSALRALVRQAAGRDPEPSAAIIDAQSVPRSAEGVVPAATSGYDSYKKVNGRKRHLLTDTAGLLIEAAVTPADAQDRDAAALLLHRARAAGRARLARVWADAGYTGDAWRGWAARELGIQVHIVYRDPDAPPHVIQTLPRRWVVERTHAWTTRRRRCARDYERLPAHHRAWIYLAAIYLMTRRPTQPATHNPQPSQGLQTASIAGLTPHDDHGGRGGARQEG